MTSHLQEVYMASPQRGICLGCGRPWREGTWRWTVWGTTDWHTYGPLDPSHWSDQTRHSTGPATQHEIKSIEEKIFQTMYSQTCVSGHLY